MAGVTLSKKGKLSYVQERGDGTGYMDVAALGKGV